MSATNFANLANVDIGAVRMQKFTQHQSAQIAAGLRAGENPIDIAQKFGLSFMDLAAIAEKSGLILGGERFRAAPQSSPRRHFGGST